MLLLGARGQLQPYKCSLKLCEQHSAIPWQHDPQKPPMSPGCRAEVAHKSPAQGRSPAAAAAGDRAVWLGRSKQVLTWILFRCTFFAPQSWSLLGAAGRLTHTRSCKPCSSPALCY